MGRCVILLQLVHSCSRVELSKQFRFRTFIIGDFSEMASLCSWARLLYPSQSPIPEYHDKFH